MIPMKPPKKSLNVELDAMQRRLAGAKQMKPMKQPMKRARTKPDFMKGAM